MGSSWVRRKRVGEQRWKRDTVTTSYFGKIIDKHAAIISEEEHLYPNIALSVNTDDTIKCSNPVWIQALFLSIVVNIFRGAKGARLDILYTISYVSTRTKIANHKEWGTLLHLSVHIKSAIKNTMTLRL